MKRLLTPAAVSALMLVAAAPAWAQSGAPSVPYGSCNRSTGDIADCLNRAIADRNDAATASYGASGVTRYDTAPAVPTTTTTTTTYSRTVYPPPWTISPPPYPGASR
jgi:hypothetical protein